MVPILLEEGLVDIDEENETGQTALHVAIINDDLEMVKILVSRGADVNRKTRVFEADDLQPSCECANSSYCLHLADEYGNEMRDDGQNALHLAAKYSSDQVVKLLAERIANVNATSDNGSTALHYATQNFLADDTDVSVMELLLNSGADINAQNLEGKTAVYLSVKFEKLKLVKYLLSRGADVNISTAKRSTPLYSAIANCHIELLNVLLRSGASSAVENQRNQSPLFYALRVVARSEERIAVVQTLLDQGVTSDCRSNYGATALHVAVQDKDEALARLMISRGCPMDAKDCFDMSPLALAVCTNLHELAQLLLEHGADASVLIKDSSVLEHAVIRRNEAMVDLLLRHEASINDSDRVLSAACTHRNTRIMQILIDHGADINRKDSKGRTPLLRVIREPNDAMMRHLVEHGARVNERNCYGNTALHVLFENSLHAKEHIIDYLLEHGADVNIENDNGHTAFEYMLLRCFTKKVVMTFVKHIVLLLERNLPVNPKITKRIQQNRRWSEYLSLCQRELRRMREARILDTCSYFDIVTNKHSSLNVLFRQDNAVLHFQCGLRKNQLFIYSDILNECFVRKSKRFELLKNGVEVMTNDVFRDIFPLEVVEYLCEYLSNDDLQKLL